MKADNIRRSVRILGEFKNTRDFENIIVSNRSDKIVYLKDVADVNFGYREAESYTRLSGKPVVSVDVAKRSGTNLLLLMNKLIAQLKQ